MKRLKSMFGDGDITIPDHFDIKLMDEVGYKKWNVYAKAPFGGPAQIVEYLGRYTHKVAITSHRITEISDTTITFNAGFMSHPEASGQRGKDKEYLSRIETALSYAKSKNRYGMESIDQYWSRYHRLQKMQTRQPDTTRFTDHVEWSIKVSL